MEKTCCLPAAVGTTLLRERKKRGLTQQGVAELAGLQRVFIVGIEAGRHSVSLETIFTLAHALNLSPHEFVCRIEATLENMMQRE